MTLAGAGRAGAIEIMDAGGYEPSEISSNLADLRFYNRWFGGARLVILEVARLLEAAGLPRRVSLLDVATGSGDIPLAVSRWAARRGIEVLAEGIDANPDVLEAARAHLSAHGRPGAPVRLVRADACRLPHADRSIDLVVCSNFLHHLESGAALAALREMRRVSRLGLVVVDLMRGEAAWALVWMLTRLTTRNRLTRHDGPLSVHRAFTPQELSRLASEAGLAGAAVRRAGPVRMVMRCRTAA